ncbi:ankyrin repeat domain-containing protein 50 [Danaus plexippus]|uniref:ankyrin repeat domain-containing protein 50 n=1 Tax=Danaus plexippus TaxID=13037 RepID=UPI002AB04A8D|nr:ankyrin repeat domain-containing protein 50 [Danaus plexippus]
MLQDYLLARFRSWAPAPPAVEERSTRDVTLLFDLQAFSFLHEHVIYRVEKKENIPPWVAVYCGGKSRKTITNLAPSHPHRFRLKVILKSSAVAAAAIKHFGDETTVYESLEGDNNSDNKRQNWSEVNKADFVNTIVCDKKPLSSRMFEGKLEKSPEIVESQYSEELWTSTESEGTSVACFCLAVSCGYLKQVQQMLEERPELVSIMNSKSGFTPLATAARKGDVSMVRFLLSFSVPLEQPSSGGQTPLMLSVLGGHAAVAGLLMDRGADLKARDINGLSVEHYAVDSCRTDLVALVLDRGGDVHVRDSNLWTPLFRAVCQGASTAMIELLLRRGSRLDVTDRRHLTLTAAARLLKDRHGGRRDSVLRLVDTQYQHEKIVANFTRLTKKISSVRTLMNIK